MLTRLAAAAIAAVLVLPGPGLAGEAGDITRRHLYEGTLAVGVEALAPLRDADQEARFGTGLLRFAQAVEHFAQALYRHGLAAPERALEGAPLMLPIPANPDPRALDYQAFRAILEALVADVDAARAELEEAGRQGDYVVPLDVLQLRIDIDGDGRGDDTESLGSIVARAIGESPAALPAMPPPAPERPEPGPLDKAGNAPAASAASASPAAVIGFDRADALWLAAYSQVFAAQADFLLAHDFEATVNAAFHRLFPRAGLPLQEFADQGTLMLDPQTDNAIADAVAAIHTINWPVVEPARLRRVMERFQTITALSRRNWQAILDETDDNAELIPSPRQTSLIPEAQVTEEVVAAWLETLDTADRILAGELLVPHWRFTRSFDLRAYFTTATHTNLVMLLTGLDAVPFLRDGPVATAQSFAEANRVFGENFLGYVFWFN